MFWFKSFWQQAEALNPLMGGGPGPRLQGRAVSRPTPLRTGCLPPATHRPAWPWSQPRLLPSASAATWPPRGLPPPLLGSSQPAPSCAVLPGTCSEDTVRLLPRGRSPSAHCRRLPGPLLAASGLWRTTSDRAHLCPYLGDASGASTSLQPMALWVEPLAFGGSAFPLLPGGQRTECLHLAVGPSRPGGDGFLRELWNRQTQVGALTAEPGD